MKKNRNEFLAAIICLGICVFLILVATNTLKKDKIKNQQYIEIDATVINVQDAEEIDDPYNYTTIKYKIEGQEYTVTSSEIGANRSQIGKNIKIKYNPNKYDEIYYDRGHIGEYFMILGGIIFGLAGLILTYKTIDLKNKTSDIKYDQTDIDNVIGPNKN